MILSMRIPAAGNMKWRVAAVICLTAGVAGMVWTVKAARMDGLNPGDMAGVLGFGAGVLSLLVGLVGTAIGWFAFRADRREYAECLELVKAADGLARAVRAQWAAETQVRRLNDPYPLSVPWQPAPADLVEPWPLLRSTALSWPGCPPGGVAPMGSEPHRAGRIGLRDHRGLRPTGTDPPSGRSRSAGGWQDDAARPPAARAAGRARRFGPRASPRAVLNSFMESERAGPA